MGKNPIIRLGTVPERSVPREKSSATPHLKPQTLNTTPYTLSIALETPEVSPVVLGSFGRLRNVRLVLLELQHILDVLKFAVL